LSFPSVSNFLTHPLVYLLCPYSVRQQESANIPNDHGFFSLLHVITMHLHLWILDLSTYVSWGRLLIAVMLLYSQFPLEMSPDGSTEFSQFGLSQLSAVSAKHQGPPLSVHQKSLTPINSPWVWPSWGL
jgi:hypothetical protein